MTDQQLLDKVIKDLGYDTATTEGSGNAGDTGDAGGIGDNTGYTSNLTTHTQKFPNSNISKIVQELQNAGVDADTINSVLQGIASGTSARSSLSGTNLRGPQASRIINIIKNLSTDDIDVLKGFGTSTPQTGGDETGGDETGELAEGFAPKRPRAFPIIWTQILGEYFNPDGSPKQSMTPDMVKDLIEKYNQALIDRDVEDQTQDITA